MSDYDDEYYNALAEDWEGYGGKGAGGGGGAKKIKKKAKPTTLGKQRIGGCAWIGEEKQCPKGCTKKCCTSSKMTPSLSA